MNFFPNYKIYEGIVLSEWKLAVCLYDSVKLPYSSYNGELIPAERYSAIENHMQLVGLNSISLPSYATKKIPFSTVLNQNQGQTQCNTFRVVNQSRSENIDVPGIFLGQDTRQIPVT